jgi:molybdopterin/thiamine biosynthesis adenylyltransferase
VCARWRPEDSKEILERADVVVDGLDSRPTRLAVAAACAELGIPFVHGAIGGWYGQVTTQLPGDTTLKKLYGRSVDAEGIEQQLGNPAFTPAVVAGLETAEVCKILLGTGKLLHNQIAFLDLLDMDFRKLGSAPHGNTAGA